MTEVVETMAMQLAATMLASDGLTRTVETVTGSQLTLTARRATLPCVRRSIGFVWRVVVLQMVLLSLEFEVVLVRLPAANECSCYVPTAKFCVLYAPFSCAASLIDDDAWHGG